MQVIIPHFHSVARLPKCSGVPIETSKSLMVTVIKVDGVGQGQDFQYTVQHNFIWSFLATKNYLIYSPPPPAMKVNKQMNL